ncbi:MAG TPA: hypothetical protein VIM58_03250, partial [Candidatus Methylacidiphilales bacterium]
MSTVVAAVFFLVLATSAGAQTQSPPLSTAYHFDPVTFYQNHNSGGPATLDWVGNYLRLTRASTTGMASYGDVVIVSSASLPGGSQYKVSLTFTVSTPTTYPDYFYIYFRNSAGTQYDIWQKFIGNASDPTRTITFPVDLPNIPGTTWKAVLGIKGPGSLIINDFIIYSGSDNVVTAPTAGGTPVSNLPSDVTEATGSAAITIAPPAATPAVTVSMANYNFVPNTGGTTATTNGAALQQAINDCKTLHATKLVIPAGIYRVSPATFFSLDTLNDLTIDGQGSTLILEKLSAGNPMFQITNCARIAILNLAIDWDWDVKPIANLGVVSNLSSDKKQCDFTFDGLTPAELALVQASSWQSLFQMDPANLVAKGPVFKPGKPTLTAGIGTTLHATFSAAVPLLQNGQSYCVRNLYYEMIAFKVANSNNLMFNGVDIYSFPGMGYLFEAATHHVELFDCTIDRPNDADYVLTTAADGVHFDQSQGNI